ncbi:MAG: hypothetical protein JNM66_03335 [Bryobacterales bacterium]|nr:hypothetical protein [Bryobacterales bacterium]
MSSSAQNFNAMNTAASTAGDNDPRSPILPCPYEKKARVRIVLKDCLLHSYKNKPYQLDAGGQVFRGNTTAEGLIDHLIPASSTAATLTAWLDEPNDPPSVWNIALEAIAPLPLETGAEDRLDNLSYDELELTGDAPPLTQKLRLFQDLLRIQGSGDLNTATTDLLAKVYSPYVGQDNTVDLRIWPTVANLPKLETEIRNLPPVEIDEKLIAQEEDDE